MQPFGLYHWPSPQTEAISAGPAGAGPSSPSSRSKFKGRLAKRAGPSSSNAKPKLPRATRACDVCLSSGTGTGRSNAKQKGGSLVPSKSVSQSKAPIPLLSFSKASRSESISLSPSPSSSTMISTSSESAKPSTPTVPINLPSDPTMKYLAVLAAPNFATGPQQQQPFGLQQSYLDDLKRLANLHDLMLYVMPLREWENGQSEKANGRDLPLDCITPNYVDPQPTQQEGAAVVQAVLETYSCPFAAVVEADCAEHNSKMAEINVQDIACMNNSSDEDRHTLAIDADNIHGSFTSSSPRGAKGKGNVDIKDTVFGTNPDFSIESFPEQYHECQSPYRHLTGRGRFNPFLYSPCRFVPTSLPQQPPAPPSPSQSCLSDSLIEGKVVPKDSRDNVLATTWDEGKPDVSQDALQHEALDKCMRTIAGRSDGCEFGRGSHLSV
uniref:Uncharacterized protein n=1 Tax=Melanopsichium pennsylvanicum 4 TaxID=1398559 RepID=A0A077QYA0_9BASI|nr:uncharacterized protein BN887_03487 [Melanopsichium pennsylvanicum 4]